MQYLKFFHNKKNIFCIPQLIQSCPLTNSLPTTYEEHTKSSRGAFIIENDTERWERYGSQRRKGARVAHTPRQSHFFIRLGGSLLELPLLGAPPCCAGTLGTAGGPIATPEALPKENKHTWHMGVGSLMLLGGWWCW